MPSDLPELGRIALGRCSRRSGPRPGLRRALRPGPTTRPSPAGRPLNVLFLGDKGHHKPADRAAQLIPVMATRGIDITYTEAMSDLNPATLAKYDALMIYANTEHIEPDQEKALLDYVEGGGGFAPIHCASYCFLNSPKYIALVGAQFKSHGTGEFDVKDVDAADPILKGLPPFRTWDETYTHTKFNEADRHLLQVRDEKGKDEPWTWTRTQGKGRVFYTAYGHDHRTWGHPGFHDLVERGVRWAAHKGDVFDSHPRVAPTVKPLRTRRPPPRSRRTPGAAWGTSGEAITRMQLPAAPAESMQHLALPQGLEPRLFAAEPAIAKPIALAWDHRGRLWIAETFDYPNEMQRKGDGHDQIKICEDTDGDGLADKFTVFADKLSIPTSLTFAGGGLIVHQAPDTLLLKDTDGDDKADVRQVLFTGWGTGDTHAGPSNLRYGFDNWLYGIVGYSGFRGEIGGEHHEFRQGFYRFQPDGSKLEFLRNTTNNSWGVGMSEEGLLFGSTANGCPSVYLPDPLSLLREGPRPPGPGRAAEHRRHEPVLPGHRQGPPGRLLRRVHRRRRPLRSTPPGLLPRPTGTASPSSPSRPGTSSPRSPWRRRERLQARTTTGTCSPPTTSGPRRSPPRWAPTGRSGSATGTTTSSSTTPRPRGSAPARGPPTRPRSATRPTAGSTASSRPGPPSPRPRPSSTRTTPPGWSPPWATTTCSGGSTPSGSSSSGARRTSSPP